jgi:hypothetical protein
MLTRAPSIHVTSPGGITGGSHPICRPCLRENTYFRVTVLQEAGPGGNAE